MLTTSYEGIIMTLQSDKNIPELPPAPDPAKPSIGQLFANLSNQISTLFRDEISLAKVEAVSKVTRIGKGGVILAVAGVLALYLLAFLLHTCAWAIGGALGSPALGYLITSGILLLIVLIVLIVGILNFKAAKKHTVAPVNGLKDSARALVKGVKK